MFAGPELKSLRPIAEKLVWWKSPDETLSDAVDFVSRVMTLGTWNDIQVVRKQWGDAAFQEALRQARPGIFDRRSWNYWHVVFGITPVPPLPERNFK